MSAAEAEPFEAEVKKPARPNVAIGNPFMFDIDLLWFVIPMRLFRSGIERRLLARIPQEVEKNLSRLASQWTDAVNASIAEIERAAIRAVREQIETVEILLSKSRSEADQIRKDMREVDLQAAAVPG